MQRGGRRIARKATHAETWKGPFVHWRAAVGAGLIAGIVFLMYEMVMLPLFLGDLAGLQLASVIRTCRRA